MRAYYISGGTIIVKIENTWIQAARSLEDKMGDPSIFTVHRTGESFPWESSAGNQVRGVGWANIFFSL
jgi:hypothetical protein